MKSLSVMVCTFKRTSTSLTERGVMVGDDKFIIDIDGKPVPNPIWDYKLYPYKGCLVVKDDVK